MQHNVTDMCMRCVYITYIMLQNICKFLFEYHLLSSKMYRLIIISDIKDNQVGKRYFDLTFRLCIFIFFFALSTRLHIIYDR